MRNEDSLKYDNFLCLGSHTSINNKSLSLPVERLTAEQMDEQRVQNVAYQYLCRLEEAKRSVQVRDLVPVLLSLICCGIYSSSCSQVDWGLPGRGTSCSHWAGGGFEERGHSCKIGSSICSKCCWSEENLWPWTEAISGNRHTSIILIIMSLFTDSLCTGKSGGGSAFSSHRQHQPVEKCFDCSWAASGQWAHSDWLIVPMVRIMSLIFILLLQIFHPETTDIYDKKNMPRAIYCVHALRSVSRFDHLYLCRLCFDWLSVCLSIVSTCTDKVWLHRFRTCMEKSTLLVTLQW